MGGIGNKAQLRPAGAGAWPELGKYDHTSEKVQMKQRAFCFLKL